MGLLGLKGGNKKSDQRAATIDTTGKKIFRYTHSLEIMPRVRQIGQKLGHFAYMLAMVFRSTRLLPDNHPMLNPANIGRYGIGDVFATAANRLVIRRENMDQVLIFGAVVAAMLMIVIQVGMIIVYTVMGSAHAADSSMFLSPSPENDVVLGFLSQVFGFKSIFGSPAAVEQPGFYKLLAFYSTAMMVIAVMIVVYYVITIVGESAQSGQPFGKRFNGLWAPIRLVLALGLLVPLGGGINAAQYLTLYVAKFGSGLATQGWSVFAQNFADPEAVIGKMSAPSAQTLASAVFSSEACRGAFNRAHKDEPNQVVIRVNAGYQSQAAAFNDTDIAFATGLNQKSLQYVWTTQGTGWSGAASPVCGEIEMPIATPPSSIKDAQTGSMQSATALVAAMQTAYVTAMGNFIKNVSGSITSIDPDPTKTITGRYVAASMTINEADNDSFAKNSDTGPRRQVITDLGAAMKTMQTDMDNGLQAAKNAMSSGAALDKVADKMKTDAQTRGWGTAGIYYLEMSKFTQMVLDSVGSAMPQPIKMPTGSTGTLSNARSWLSSWWNGSGDDVNKQIGTVIKNVPIAVAAAASVAQVSVNSTNPNEQFTNSAGNYITDPILTIAHLLFGQAFFALLDQPKLNPMQNLITGGAYVLDRVKWMAAVYVFTQLGAVGAMIAGVGGAAAGAAATVEVPPAAFFGAVAGFVGGMGGYFMISSLLKALGAIIWFFMMLGAAVGIVLFYLLPLLPFMYFFFSVVNWVIEVGEAFISMPLFALSHLRIDGEGLLPQRAYENWLILFGILLRPLMIVTGMILGSLIFNAGAYYLAVIYKYAIFAYNNEAVTGAAALNPWATGGAGLTATGLDFSKVSGFGMITYMVLYVYLIYMLATSSFKLIDSIPDKMLRWIGGPTPFTGDRPVDLGNMQNMALLGYGVMREGHSAMSQVGQNIGQGLNNRAKSGGAGGKSGTSDISSS